MSDNHDFITPIPIPESPQDEVNTPQLSESEERTLAVIAHLGIFLNLVTGLLGLVVPLVIYLAYKDRSRYVAYQSLQALVFQLVFWVGGGLLAALLWIIALPLSLVLVGLCLIPFALIASLIPLGAYVYAVFAAVDTGQHRDFQYWMIGDWVRGTYTGE